MPCWRRAREISVADLLGDAAVVRPNRVNVVSVVGRVEQCLETDPDRISDRAVAIDVDGERHGLSRGDHDRPLQVGEGVGHSHHHAIRFMSDEDHLMILRHPVRPDLGGQPELHVIDLDLLAVRIDSCDGEPQHLAIHDLVTEIDGLDDQLIGERDDAATDRGVVVGAGSVIDLRLNPLDRGVLAADLGLVTGDEGGGGEDGGDGDDGAHCGTSYVLLGNCFTHLALP